MKKILEMKRGDGHEKRKEKNKRKTQGKEKDRERDIVIIYVTNKISVLFCWDC